MTTALAAGSESERAAIVRNVLRVARGRESRVPSALAALDADSKSDGEVDRRRRTAGK